MSKTVPSFLFPTNFRNGKNVKRLIKDFNIQGYGIVVYLLETLAEAEGHKYPIDDIDLLADEMKVSIPVIKTVITSYSIFQIIEDEQGSLFISLLLQEWLEPYYKLVEQRRLAGKSSAEKRKKAKSKQVLELSQDNSNHRQFNDRSTINKLIKESSSFNNKEEEDSLLIKNINALVGKRIFIKISQNNEFVAEGEMDILQVDINESEKEFILKVSCEKNGDIFNYDLPIKFSSLEEIESKLIKENSS